MVGGMARRGNPTFTVAVITVPLFALAYAVTAASDQFHTYIHVMIGLLWTGTDIFIGAVLGPVIGGLDEEQSATVFERLTPKTAFLLPALAFTTIVGGITLAERLNVFPHADVWLPLFTAANVIPILLLFGYRINVFGDRR
jgi:hypothetical protein